MAAPARDAPSAPDTPVAPGASTDALTCDHCGAETLSWVKCKLICRNCRQIVKSCADL